MATVTIASIWPLALLAALPLVWILAWRNRAGVGHARVTAATVLRSVALAAIVAALLRPTLHRISDDISIVYVLDVSGSVAPNFPNEALDWIAQVNMRYQPARSRVVVFANHAELVDSVDAARTLALTTKGAARNDTIDQAATNLEGGLLAALPGLAPGLAKRIVLLSDGNQTEGDAWAAMLRLRTEGARVFAVPAPVAAGNDAWVERITVPPGAHARAAVEVEARVFSRRSVPAQIELVIGETIAAARAVTLSPGLNRVSFPVRFPRAGIQNVSVRISAEGDELARNDMLTEDVMVQPRPHALFVEGSLRGERYLADALTSQGIRVSVASAEELADARSLIGKDVVILSDVRADSLATETVQRLAAFVRDQGGGLIFTAGQNTYGQEGFAKSEVERLLPVTFEAKRKSDDLDLVLLVDRSSSMRGQKIEVSKSAALATLDQLESDHRLAVVAFDAQPHDVVPLTAVGNKREAEDLISRMTSSGQTNIYNALLKAQELLAPSKAKTKHIILLSDGLTSPPPGGTVKAFYPTEIEQRLREVQTAERRQRGGADEPARGPQASASPRGFPGIMEELVEAKITMSTVAIGEKPDVELMANLANWGRGRSYVTRSDAEVPTLFAMETRRLLNDSIVEERFRPRVKAWSPTLSGLDFAGGPELKGFVATKPKRSSEVLLVAKKDLPLLAETHYGLGKTVAFLSDVKNRWAADWLDWPGYARLWAQVVRDSARRDSGEGVNWGVTREGRDAFVQLTALGADGRFRNGLWPAVRVTPPGGQPQVADLRQVAPGLYRAQVPLGASGRTPWRFDLLPGPGLSTAEITRAGSRRLFYTYPDEYRLLPANLPLLRTLSEQTGGTLAPDAQEIFTPRGDGGVTSTPLWPYCAGAALLVFLLDILVRRSPWRLRRGR